MTYSSMDRPAKLLRCLRENTTLAPGPVPDSYLLPDGEVWELTDDFPRHERVYDCYRDWKADEDPPGSLVVADFINRTGAIRVGYADYESGEFQLAADRKPTEEQLKVMERHCDGGRWVSCNFEATGVREGLDMQCGFLNNVASGRELPTRRIVRELYEESTRRCPV